MHRSRSVLAAGGISLVLVVGSAAFAYANGVFGSPATDRVGTFQEIQAQLAAQTEPTSTVVSSIATSPTTVPRTAPAAAGAGWTSVPTVEPRHESPDAPTTSGLDHATTVTHDDPSAERRGHDDDGEPEEHESSDDRDD